MFAAIKRSCNLRQDKWHTDYEDEGEGSDIGGFFYQLRDRTSRPHLNFALHRDFSHLQIQRRLLHVIKKIVQPQR